ncbi:MAG TPA: lyase family protein, partial [Terriglobales bacterium]|nr:lyase family protein [Terriglobales bacterium]
MWSGRFRQPLDPEFEQWQRSFPFDKRLLPQEIAASSAHARALERVGVLSSAELNTLLEALEHVKHACESDPRFLEDSEAEDVHHFLERRLGELAVDVGLKLHAGRSRNEQVSTDLRLFVRDAIDGLHSKLVEFVETI